MKILFAASEGLPYSKTGGLADVVEALPKALVALGHEVSVILPRYRKNPTEPVLLPSLTLAFGERLRFPSIVDGGAREGVRYFFVDDPEYFDREQLYGVQSKDYPDNAERFGEYARAVVEFAKRAGPFDVIHAHDWQAALTPAYLHYDGGRWFSPSTTWGITDRFRGVCWRGSGWRNRFSTQRRWSFTEA